jgi:hypothetical protein
VVATSFLLRGWHGNTKRASLKGTAKIDDTTPTTVLFDVTDGKTAHLMDDGQNLQDSETKVRGGEIVVHRHV